MVDKCFFTNNIVDALECSKDGEFDENGFAINKCKEWPCEKYDKYTAPQATPKSCEDCKHTKGISEICEMCREDFFEPKDA